MRKRRAKTEQPPAEGGPVAAPQGAEVANPERAIADRAQPLLASVQRAIEKALGVRSGAEYDQGVAALEAAAVVRLRKIMESGGDKDALNAARVVAVMRRLNVELEKGVLAYAGQCMQGLASVEAERARSEKAAAGPDERRDLPQIVAEVAERTVRAMGGAKG